MKVLPSGRKLHHGPKRPRQKDQPLDGLCSGPLLAAARTAARNLSSPSGRNSIASMDSFEGACCLRVRSVSSRWVGMVNNPKQQDVPAFYSPLTHTQHAQLGRIAVLWGQVEMFVENLLTAVLGIEPLLRARLFNDKPIGAKLDTLSSFAKDMQNAPAAQAVRTFLTLAQEVKLDRNQCFHGVWGFRVRSKQQQIEAAAMHQRSPEKPFRADNLPRLERRLCQLSHLGMLALESLGEMDRLNGAYPLFHGDPPTEEWSREWRAQHYADRQIPSDTWKPGRLPFLEHPLGSQSEHRPGDQRH